MARIVIAGAGQGGFQVAASLRQEGFAGEIVLVGDEPGLPYQRPPLSKAYLKEGQAERLLFRNADFYEKNAITLELGRHVSEIDRAAHLVALDDGRVLDYDHLVIALGARNRRLPIPGLDLANVLELRSTAHADAIRARLATARSMIVIGGGFIGLEVAATAQAAGVQVTVLEATARLMSRVVSPPVSDYFLSAHQARGTNIRLEAFAARILDDGNGAVAGVETASGERIEGDTVLVSAGIVPNAEIAERAGLFVHDGIRVDDRMLTEDPAISALGDCASFPFGQDGTAIRLESVQNAIDQAKCIASRLMGKPERYDKVPWFWSDQGADKLQIAGLISGADHHQVVAADNRLVVHCFRRGEFIGLETVNAPADHMMARRILAASRPLTREEARSAGFDTKTMNALLQA